MSMRQLIPALDAIASLRDQVLLLGSPLTAAATLAELAGASAVRIGVCEELRPVTDNDLRDLRQVLRGFELRMPPMPTLVKSALEARPDRVLLASEVRSSGHGGGPLDFTAWGSALPPVIRTLEEAGIEVAARIPAHPEAVKAARTADLRAVELETGQLVDLPAQELRSALEPFADAARLAAKLGLRVGLGGRLDGHRLLPFLEAAPGAEWVAVGREWVARSLLVGIDGATRDLRSLL
ncbi:MAG: hypothetical protein CL910_03350 [Deltaproteobacteria bacterium]|jgi:pyridoxine 5-phosphate synthase|nr:hypothetical protein [Deltaproteobacteria bacterium]